MEHIMIIYFRKLCNIIIDYNRSYMLEHLVQSMLEKTEDKKESFTNYNSSGDTSITYTVLIFWVVLGIFAVYLSWTCNTASKAPTFLKIIYAFFAWFFGIFYLIFYFFYNYLGKQCGK